MKPVTSFDSVPVLFLAIVFACWFTYKAIKSKDGIKWGFAVFLWILAAGMLFLQPIIFDWLSQFINNLWFFSLLWGGAIQISLCTLVLIMIDKPIKIWIKIIVYSIVIFVASLVKFDEFFVSVANYYHGGFLFCVTGASVLKEFLSAKRPITRIRLFGVFVGIGGNGVFLWMWGTVALLSYFNIPSHTLRNIALIISPFLVLVWLITAMIPNRLAVAIYQIESFARNLYSLFWLNKLKKHLKAVYPDIEPPFLQFQFSLLGLSTMIHRYHFYFEDMAEMLARNGHVELSQVINDENIESLVRWAKKSI